MSRFRVEILRESEHIAPRQARGLLSSPNTSNDASGMQKNVESRGKIPTQLRAQRTIADLFEATAQLLDADLPERLTTNHVAARAGYSIGTLYRYFPSKLALVRAMAVQEIHVQGSKVQAALQELAANVDAEPCVRILVRAVLHPFAGRHRVHVGVLRLLATEGDPSAASNAQTNDMSASVNNAFCSVHLAVLSDVSREAKFTMIHAVTGAIEAPLRSKPELIASREFEDQLVGLVLHFLQADKRCIVSPSVRAL